LHGEKYLSMCLPSGDLLNAKLMGRDVYNSQSYCNYKVILILVTIYKMYFGVSHIKLININSYKTVICYNILAYTSYFKNSI